MSKGPRGLNPDQQDKLAPSCLRRFSAIRFGRFTATLAPSIASAWLAIGELG